MDNGELPIGWAIGSVDTFGELHRGISYKKEESSASRRPGLVPILRANNISNNSLNFDDLVFVPKSHVQDFQFIKRGDLVFCMSSGSKGLVGKCARAESDVEASYGAFCAMFRLKPHLSSEFLSYFFQTSTYRKRIGQISKGTNINNLKREHILELQVPIPPSGEQERIVEKVEELFSDLDKSVESLKTALEQLKAYRQSLLKCAFEGKLTELWRKRNNCKINEFEKIDATDLPELPQSWSYVRAEHLCHFITKGTTPKKGELYPAKGDVPFIKVYNLTFDGQLDFSIDPTFVSNESHKGFLARSVVYPRDVLMNIVGPPLGKVSLVPESFPEWNINQAIARFRPKEQLNPKYLMYFLLSAITVDRTSKKAKATAGQFNLTLEICRDIEVPLCHPNEQAEVVRILDSQLSIADQLANEIESALTNADALRQSILKQAFSGKLVPQDPNDEPAAVLLERLKAELQNSNGNGARHKSSKGKRK